MDEDSLVKQMWFTCERPNKHDSSIPTREGKEDAIERAQRSAFSAVPFQSLAVIEYPRALWKSICVFCWMHLGSWRLTAWRRYWLHLRVHYLGKPNNVTDRRPNWSNLSHSVGKIVISLPGFLVSKEKVTFCWNVPCFSSLCLSGCPFLKHRYSVYCTYINLEAHTHKSSMPVKLPGF